MEQAVVIASICPLMSAPSLQSEQADEALFGWPLSVLERHQPGWLLVQTHYGYTGYAPESCIRIGPVPQSWQPKHVVCQSWADMLAVPQVESCRLVTLPRGAWAAVLEEQARWQRVALPDGREGYVQKGALRQYGGPAQRTPEQLRAALVDSAWSYLGTQYRWGGKTPMGIDCSGLTFMSYFLNGILIYRDAKIEEGFPVHPIPFSEAAPGDLLYFPGHVALYLGRCRFLHATARSGKVVVSSLSPDGPDYRADLRESLTAVGSIFPLTL
ncbi:MAG: peptidase [Oscillospiraceae bacterium]|nr:peptidase [Oscillospiraceae bacterium]